MFDAKSRYAAIETAEWQNPAEPGQRVLYKRRRFPQPAGSLVTLTELTVVAGDRLDLIAARTLGDPEAFWQICDANDALDPLELTAQPGRWLRITLPLP